jgi:hypothetical protein
VAKRTNPSSDRVDLPDGRVAHLLTYADGSVRLRLTGDTSYAITDAHLGLSQQGHITLKLTPVK